MHILPFPWGTVYLHKLLSMISATFQLTSRKVMSPASLYHSSQHIPVLMSPFHFLSVSGLSLLMFLTAILVLSDGLMKMFFIKNMPHLLMMVILYANISSLIPFMFCLSSYLWTSFLFSISWVTFVVLFKNYSNCDKFLSHLLPLSSPLMLWDFLIILEVLSNLIRPLTLSLRLTCNLMTGHVLMSLAMVGKSSTILVALMSFEMVISLIQSQVFSMLSQSYLAS